MKRKIFTLICSALIVSSVSAQKDSLLRFVGFDSPADTASSIFTFGNNGKGKDGTTPSTGSAKIVATGGHTGAYWQETITGISANSNDWDNQFCVEMLQAKDFTTYRVSCWLKSDQATVADSAINFTIGKYSYSEFSRMGAISAPTKWTKYTMMMYVDTANSLPKDVNGFTTGLGKFRLPFHARRNGVLGYDDIKVEKAGCGDLTAKLDTIYVDFGAGWALDNTLTLEASMFTVLSGTTPIAVSGAIFDDANLNVVKLKLASIPSSSDTLFLSYTGNLEYSNGGPADGLTRKFTKSIVENLNGESSVKPTEIASIVVSPNPVQDILTVSNVNVKTVEIFNMTGQKVQFSNHATLNVSSLAKGVYFIKVNGASTTKFVKN